MNVPAELKYTKEHEWIRVEGEEAVVGITDYAQSQLGDIVFVECETVGDALEACIPDLQRTCGKTFRCSECRSGNHSKSC